MNSESRTKRRGSLTPMREAMRSFLKESGLSQKLRDWPVYEAWSEAVGKTLAQRARPVSFDRGQLLVEVESATHMHELKNFTGERYRKLANERLGRERILRVAFKLKR